MQDLLIVTVGEWVLLLLATVALIHGAVICMNMRKNLVRAEARPAFSGLMGALADTPKRTALKATKSHR